MAHETLGQEVETGWCQPSSPDATIPDRVLALLPTKPEDALSHPMTGRGFRCSPPGRNSTGRLRKVGLCSLSEPAGAGRALEGERLVSAIVVGRDRGRQLIAVGGLRTDLQGRRPKAHLKLIAPGRVQLHLQALGADVGLVIHLARQL